MCGIIYQSEYNDTGIIGTLSHRGPDEERFVENQIGYWGHSRLSIIDLTSDSSQPMTSLSGNSLIIFNGEIYNYKSLRSDLVSKGIQFKSNGDTEVILNGIENYGIDFIQKLDGMFAFIFADLKTGKLIFARDFAGKNPLYFSSKHGLTAASEIRTILKAHPDIKEINDKGLQQFVRYGIIPEPDTLWRDIEMFPSGYYGIWTGNRFDLTPIRAVAIENNGAGSSHEDVKKQIRNLVSAAVSKRLVSDVAIGTFLSGGIDSSLLVGLMSKEFSLKPKTFSVVFDDQEFSEESRIEKVVSKWKPDHEYIRLNLNNVLDEIPDSLNAYDHPSIDGVNTFIVSKAVRSKGYKVALSGLGGDELFQGYGTFNQARFIQKYGKLIGLLPDKFVKNNSRYGRIKDSFSTDINHQPISSIRSLYSEQQLINLFGKNYLGWFSIISDYDDSKLNELSGDSKLIALEWFGYMKNMLIRDTNIMSMANSLEVRAPFTDRELLSYILHLPDSIKRPGKTKKQLLVESCSDWVLPEIIESHKMGFVLPMKEWLLGPLNQIVRKNIDTLGNYEATSPLKIKALENIKLLEENKTTWPRVWQWVILGKTLEKRS